MIFERGNGCIRILINLDITIHRSEKMKCYLKIFMSISALFLFLVLPFSSQEKTDQSKENLVSLIRQNSGLDIQLEDLGWQWKEEDIKGTKERGEITFSDTKWLMYLIHWGPIQTPEITVDYVKERMLKMWGVKFEFTGKEGMAKVAGHDAVWAEAYGTNKSFYTRFIIWNCPQSGREFIADTNYNLKRKTPRENFEQEMRSAKTIQCHKGAVSENFSDLTKKFESERYGFVFNYPEEWFVFESPFYVPFPQYEGVRNREIGSLLCLCSDQNISITLKWYPLDKKQKQGFFMGVQQKLLEYLKNQIKSHKDVEKFQNQGMEEFKIGDKKITRIWGACRFKEPETDTGKDFFTGKGIYQVAQWDLKKEKKIVVILTTKQYRYGSGISTPSRHFHDMFLKDFILKIQTGN